MKTKDVKKLAKEIMTLEDIIDTSEDEDAINKAKNRILEISHNISVEDMIQVDEYIQDHMQNQS